MPVIGSALFLLWLLAAIVSLVCIRDVFSPDKLIITALGVFFADIYVSPYSEEVLLSYVLLVLAFITTVIVLAPTVRHIDVQVDQFQRPRTDSPSKTLAVGHGFFWAISVPALAAQVAMIANFGGFEGYINVLAMRVIEFQGLGWLTAIIQTFAIVDLVYFAFVVTRRQPQRAAWKIYSLHLLVFVILALLTGSRGSLLVNFVLMAMIHHHLVKQARLRWLVMVAVSTLLVASVLEVAREGVSIGDDGLTTGLSEINAAESNVGLAWTAYGTTPLELVLDAQYVNKHYGFTYLTWFTNMVPRAFWPDKPDSGGVVLTKEYTGDAWGGSSHLSTGILPEAIINFGQVTGLVVGILQLVLILSVLLVLYTRYKKRFARRGRYAFIDGVRFCYINWAMMGLIVGEFTNIMLTLTAQLFTVWVTFAAIRFGESHWSGARAAAGIKGITIA